MENVHSLIHALYTNALRLSSRETIICSKSTTILGWIWSNGSSHRLSTLSTCATPAKVRGLRSFIEAFEVLARVIPNCSSLLSPLEEAIAGRQSQEKLNWSKDVHGTFRTAQAALSSTGTITLPRPNDQLWIVTYGSVKKHSIDATLYVTRLAGFFSAKLCGRQHAP